MLRLLVASAFVLVASSAFACDDLPGYPDSAEVSYEVTVVRDSDGLMVEVPSYATFVRDEDGLPCEVR